MIAIINHERVGYKLNLARLGSLLRRLFFAR